MQSSLLPERCRVLSGSGLKTLAMLAMLIDHSALAFRKLLTQNVFPDVALGPFFSKFLGQEGVPVETLNQFLNKLLGMRFTTYVLLRGIGRIAFPIFCFLLAEGFRHTRSKSRYALNLLIFAVLSEIPYNIVHEGKLLYPGQNVFFTLLLGCLGMWVISRIDDIPRWPCLGLIGLGLCAWLLQKDIPLYGPIVLILLGVLAALIKKEVPLRGGLILIGLGVCAILLHCDYDWKGYLLLLLMYLLGEHPMVQCFAGVTLLGWPGGVAFAYPLMNLYNGKRGYIQGPAAKYAFYLFYPVHLTLIWLIRLKTIGY